MFQVLDFSASTALQNNREASPVERAPSLPGSPSTKEGCSSHISVGTLSPLSKVVSSVKISMKSQGTQRAAVTTSSPYEPQLELQEGKTKTMVIVSEPGS
jgi:hypothetical protein